MLPLFYCISDRYPYGKEKHSNCVLRRLLIAKQEDLRSTPRGHSWYSRGGGLGEGVMADCLAAWPHHMAIYAPAFRSHGPPLTHTIHSPLILETCKLPAMPPNHILPLTPSRNIRAPKQFPPPQHTHTHTQLTQAFCEKAPDPDLTMYSISCYHGNRNNTKKPGRLPPILSSEVL